MDFKVGEIFTNNFGTKCIIIDIIDNKRVLIQWMDEFECISNVSKNSMYHKSNKIEAKNPYDPCLCGVGRIGCYDKEKHSPDYYSAWKGMIKRCYGKSNKNIFYHDCTVDERWLIYSNFLIDYSEMIEDIRNKGYVGKLNIDKDLLKKGNKIYSKETCCLLSPQINTFISTLNRSGVRASNNKFQARIGEDNKLINIGVFAEFEDARVAYLEKKKEHFDKILKNNEWWLSEKTLTVLESIF